LHTQTQQSASWRLDGYKTNGVPKCGVSLFFSLLPSLVSSDRPLSLAIIITVIHPITMNPTPISDACHFVRDAPTVELAKSVHQPGSFKILYFPIHAAGACSRELLGYGKDKFASEAISPAVSRHGTLSLSLCHTSWATLTCFFHNSLLELGRREGQDTFPLHASPLYQDQSRQGKKRQEEKSTADKPCPKSPTHSFLVHIHKYLGSCYLRGLSH